MQSQDGEEEEIFLDSLEFVSTASESAGDPSTAEASEREFVSSDYEVWIDDLSSIRERRSRFLRKMCFDDMAPSETFPCPEINSCSATPQRLELNGAMDFCDSDVDYLFRCREGRGEAFLAIDLGEQMDAGRLIVWEEFESSLGFPQRKKSVSDGENPATARKKSPRNWWKRFSAATGKLCKCSLPTETSRDHKPGRRRSKLEKHWKGDKKSRSMSMKQEFPAHKGSITAMKFSPDGRFLATGGEDCAVRIWRAEDEEGPDCRPAIKNLKLAETPLRELHGHTGDVLDLSWSESAYLLSSSKDKTVRLWQSDRNHCLKIFQHSNYVTCVQFNPADDGQFISGSIDGKVRIWGIPEARVVDWVDIGDIITAICYRPDGQVSILLPPFAGLSPALFVMLSGTNLSPQGFVAGSITGDCRFYSSGENLQLEKEVRIRGRKKPAAKSVTGFQFSPRDPERIMVTSADGKVRIYDRVKEVMKKCRGAGRSKGQITASFTSDGKFVVSVGDDCSVLVRDHGGAAVAPPERFFSEAAALAATWPNPTSGNLSSGPTARLGDTERSSLGAWFFFAEFPARVSATWPEEKLSLGRGHFSAGDCCLSREAGSVSEGAWSRVIVTAGHDGVIRSFQSH